MKHDQKKRHFRFGRILGAFPYKILVTLSTERIEGSTRVELRYNPDLMEVEWFNWIYNQWEGMYFAMENKLRDLHYVDCIYIKIEEDK